MNLASFRLWTPPIQIGFNFKLSFLRFFLAIPPTNAATVMAPAATLTVNVNASYLMPPSDNKKGSEVYPREADERFVYVQRKISTYEYNIDVCAIYLNSFSLRT